MLIFSTSQLIWKVDLKPVGFVRFAADGVCLRAKAAAAVAVAAAVGRDAGDTADLAIV